LGVEEALMETVGIGIIGLGTRGLQTLGRTIVESAHETDYGPSWLDESEEKYMDDVCVYAPGADLYHYGSLQFRYQNGVLASYFYSLFGPHADDQETMELVGTSGRIRLIRHTGTLDVVRDRGAERAVTDCRDERFGGSHFGADVELIRELRRFYDGAPPLVSARSGLEATRMVMAALRSMDGGGVLVSMDEITDAKN
jgi:predicted dehydrogenase